MRRYALILLLPFLMANEDCGKNAVSSSGVAKANTRVETGTDGLTVEQRNIKDRLAIDNKPGSLKHLYVISSMSGQVMLYSTVRGKVTSGNKRLSPSMVTNQNGSYGFTVDFDGHDMYTNEVLGDDGTYGGSGDYLFWFDATGRYHQQYTDGCSCVIHVSDQPIAVKSVTINLEQPDK